MAKKINKWLFWTPRVLSILFILFIALFSFDVFDPENNYNISQMILAFFMHNLITIILIIFLIFAWKREWLGALGFLLFAIWYVGFIFKNIFTQGFEWYYLSWFFIIAFPALVIAFLWWINWKRRRR